MTERDGGKFVAFEAATRTFLTPGDYGVIRLDGRAFHSYCGALDKPNDDQFIADMDAVAIELRRQIDGVRLSYVQSDEISLLLTDWTPRNDAIRRRSAFMFGGNIQKLVSISAAIASTTLNRLRLGKHTDKVALFDARAFSIHCRDDVVECFAWRQRDAGINSLSMHASAHFSHKQLHGLSSAARRELLLEHGIDPSTAAGFRHGRVVTYVTKPGAAVYRDKNTDVRNTVEFERHVPVTMTAPRFASDDSLIP